MFGRLFDASFLLLKTNSEVNFARSASTNSVFPSISENPKSQKTALFLLKTGSHGMFFNRFTWNSAPLPPG